MMDPASMTEAEVLAAMQGGGAGTGSEYKENLNVRLICPDCLVDPPNLVEEFSQGDIVCADCGMVLGDRIIDTRSEWRTFANDDQGNDDPSRVGDGSNPLLNGSQLETTIGFGEGSRSRDLHRAHTKIQNNDKTTKTLLAAYREISQFCDTINIPKAVQDSAKHIFKLVEDAKVFKGKPQEPIVAGCIFIACRQADVPRTFREIFNLTNVSKKEIGRTFKTLEKFLMEKNQAESNESVQSTTTASTTGTNAEALCGRYCSHLGFRDYHKLEKLSKELAVKSSSVKGLAGRSPLSVAAACIYMASHLMSEPKSSKDIAQVAGVSDGTIKTAYRFLYTARDHLIDKSWVTPPNKGNVSKLPAN